MNKMIAFVIIVIASAHSHAQGVQQLWGLSEGDGTTVLRHLFSWDSATNTIHSRQRFHPSIIEQTPISNFTEYNGLLYGVTESSIFQLDPSVFENAHANKRISVNGISNGNLAIWNNKLYGLTQSGGAADSGFIFEYDPIANTITEKIVFDYTKGSKPRGGLVLLDDKFYGMTAKGGLHNLGVIFEWDPSTNNFTTKFDFDGGNGSSPNANLTWNGSLFFGTTDSGGVNNAGVLFSWDPALNNFIKKEDFDITNGKKPSGTMVFADDKLYGMTTFGGSTDFGVLYEWNISEENFTKQVDMNESDGGNPNGSLIMKDAKLYGYTTSGIIEWDSSATSYTKKQNRGSGEPFTHLTVQGGKLYGVSTNFSTANIFEWDNNANSISEITVSSSEYEGFGLDPNFPSGLGAANGKIYGLTPGGGPEMKGMIWKYDPSIYNGQLYPIDFFYGPNGQYPFGTAFHGMTPYGGIDGVAYSFSIYSETIQIDQFFNGQYHWISNPSGGKNLGGRRYMIGSRLLHLEAIDQQRVLFDLGAGSGEPDIEGNIGVTDGGGGANNMGYIFSYHDAESPDEEGILEDKIDFNGTNGSSPNGTFTLFNGKYYGTTRTGGNNGQGTLYEWDPVNNIFTTLIHFDGTTTGQVTSPLTVMNNKLYGMRSGGVNNKGMVFEFDPATNQFTNKGVFDGTTNGENSTERLVVMPAGIARSTPGVCVGFPSVTIDATNNSKWVPVTDSNGDVLAELNANGNNLGQLTIQAYVNAGPVREDAQGHVYLDRNITITPAQQPSGDSVSVRIYIPQSEFETLLNAANPAISNINDVAIFKGSENCDNHVQNAMPLLTTSEAYAHGYILTTNIASFSSFYFASRTFAALPLQLLSFSAVAKNGDAALSWETSDEYHVSAFDVERSIDKINFTAVGSIAANNTAGNHNYSFTDPDIQSHGIATLYYRVKMKDIDGRFVYSTTIALQLHLTTTSIQFYPNPVSSMASLVINTDKSQQLQWRILNNTGKTLSRNVTQINKGVVSLPVELGHLPKGIYYLDVKGTYFSKIIRLVKQ